MSNLEAILWYVLHTQLMDGVTTLYLYLFQGGGLVLLVTLISRVCLLEPSTINQIQGGVGVII